MIHPLQKCKQHFANKNVLIFGLGLLGRGVGDAAFFARIGSHVKVTDIKNESQLSDSLQKLRSYKISYTLGKHQKEDIDWADYIIRNASVPWKHELLEYARSTNKPIYMDTQLFLSFAQIESVGITGTRGKTTTTQLAYTALKTLDRQVLLGGNIQGIATLPLLETLDLSQDPVIVLELSSWQLASFRAHKLSPNKAIVTNIYPDHLNTYDSMKDYIHDKLAITINQSSKDYLFLNANQKQIVKSWSAQTKAKTIWFSKDDVSLNGTHLKGVHNQENLAAATSLASVFGISNEAVIESIKTVSVPFRLQEITMLNGSLIVNDTTSTTPVATMVALRTYPQSVLILGGMDKKLPVDELISTINNLAADVVLIPGTGTDRVKQRINPKKILGYPNTLEEALDIALSKANHKTILFSPGFTSFGMFKNEFDRGEQFNQLVEHYAEKQQIN